MTASASEPSRSGVRTRVSGSPADEQADQDECGRQCKGDLEARVHDQADRQVDLVLDREPDPDDVLDRVPGDRHDDEPGERLRDPERAERRLEGGDEPVGDDGGAARGDRQEADGEGQRPDPLDRHLERARARPSGDRERDRCREQDEQDDRREDAQLLGVARVRARPARLPASGSPAPPRRGGAGPRSFGPERRRSAGRRTGGPRRRTPARGRAGCWPGSSR